MKQMKLRPKRKRATMAYVHELERRLMLAMATVKALREKYGETGWSNGPEPQARPVFVARPDCQHGCRMINDPDSDYRGCSCEGGCLECHRRSR